MFATSIPIQKICLQHFLLTLYTGKGTTINVGFSSSVITNVCFRFACMLLAKGLGWAFPNHNL